MHIPFNCFTLRFYFKVWGLFWVLQHYLCIYIIFYIHCSESITTESNTPVENENNVLCLPLHTVFHKIQRSLRHLWCKPALEQSLKLEIRAASQHGVIRLYGHYVPLLLIQYSKSVFAGFEKMLMNWVVLKMLPRLYSLQYCCPSCANMLETSKHWEIMKNIILLLGQIVHQDYSARQ